MLGAGIVDGLSCTWKDFTAWRMRGVRERGSHKMMTENPLEERLSEILASVKSNKYTIKLKNIYPDTKDGLARYYWRMLVANPPTIVVDGLGRVWGFNRRRKVKGKWGLEFVLLLKE
jgi:hypothetical protein